MGVHWICPTPAALDLSNPCCVGFVQPLLHWTCPTPAVLDLFNPCCIGFVQPLLHWTCPTPAALDLSNPCCIGLVPPLLCWTCPTPALCRMGCTYLFFTAKSWGVAGGGGGGVQTVFREATDLMERKLCALPLTSQVISVPELRQSWFFVYD